jgi:hypothetical protein
MRKYVYIIGVLAVMLSTAGCKEDIVTSLFTDDSEVKAGDPVMFTTYVPGKPVTRAMTQEQFTARMDSFLAVAADYEFTVEMYEEGNGTALGSGTYLPTPASNSTGYAADGTLTAKAGEASLYWPSTKKAYGFKAWAHNTPLEDDQTDAAKLFRQDYVMGYGFLPIWNGDATPPAPKYDEDGLNFLTPKQWKDENETLGMNTDEAYKKIPLYMKHQRAKITVILKAGEGVDRSDLAFATAATNIKMEINSHKTVGESKVTTKIHPFAEEEIINYGTEAEHDDVSSTKYTAIVEPWDYLQGAASDVIADIHLSKQHFTFYAGNDSEYTNYSVSPAPSEDAEGYTAYKNAKDHMNNYNLTAGKHLTITATLSRDTRKIVITAYIEDWDETVTSSVVDDYGQTVTPTPITTRADLIAFLNNPEQNKPGNVAIIVPNSINLEKTDDGNDDSWGNYIKDLNCTLNMAGATFYTNHRLFSNINSTGSLINGTVCVGNAQVESALSPTNYGTIDRIDVLPKTATTAVNNHSSGKATRAGLVVDNYGTITSCKSELPVQGTADFDGFVGGIAARSVYASGASPKMPVIDGCTVNARVDGTLGASTSPKSKGGGIVGEAVGRVTNNTFEYGVTLLQYKTILAQNIVYQKADQKNADNQAYSIRAYNNAWPTKAENPLDGGNVPNTNAASTKYDAVIDCQDELAYILETTSYNQLDKTYRISNDFTLSGWNKGKVNTVFNNTGGGVLFKLDGNNKTITTDGMLFSNIMNDIWDLTIALSKNLIVTSTDGNDAIAALGFSVSGFKNETTNELETTPTLSNIQVKGGNYRMQAATVGGIVVWAFNGATIENCKCKAILQVWMDGELTQGVRKYSGGIVACAVDATITRCQFYTKDINTLFRNKAATHDGEVDKEKTASAGFYYGGILGGTTTWENVATATPSVKITDCYSWYGTDLNSQDSHNNNYQGAIVGYSQYTPTTGSTTDFVSGLAEGCEGNWWSNTSDGIGTHVTGKTVEQILGKPNSVIPSEDLSF